MLRASPKSWKSRESIGLDISEGFASVRMDEWFARKHRGRWYRLSAGWGAKGPRWFDWAWRTMEAEVPEGWQAWVVARRSLIKFMGKAYLFMLFPYIMPKCISCR